MGGASPEARPPRGCQGRVERKGRPGPDSAARLPAPSAISSILGTWLDQYSEDFCQPPDFPCLRQLVAYVQLNMPGSDLERRAHLLLGGFSGEPEKQGTTPKPAIHFLKLQ